MRLRNAKDTVRPTLHETLNDVHPLDLDEPFHFLVDVRTVSPLAQMHAHPSLQHGVPVWVKTSTSGWRRGTVLWPELTLYEETVCTSAHLVL